MARYSIEFLRYLIRLRGPRTSLTAAESALLRSLVADRTCVVEVGVFEGVTSAVLAEAISPKGMVYLVDPYVLGVRLERWLRFSFTEVVARRSVQPWRRRVRFVRKNSLRPPSPSSSRRSSFSSMPTTAMRRYAKTCWRGLRSSRQEVSWPSTTVAVARLAPTSMKPPGQCGSWRRSGAGLYGPWKAVGEADSLTAIAKIDGGAESPRLGRSIE